MENPERRPAAAVGRSPRGGRRPNSGRKTKDPSEKSVTVSFSCTPSQKAELQAAARASGMGQSGYILSKLMKEAREADRIPGRERKPCGGTE